MMDTLIAYWHKDGLDVYRVADKKPVKYASGSLDKLKPFGGWGIGKKILIVGREHLFYTRKKYPPAPKEKLVKAVSLDIGEIFPLSKPAFYCRVFEDLSTATLLDIWAWESDQYNRVKEIFPFGYAIPEDIICTSKDFEVKIFPYKDITNILAHSKDKFLAGTSCSTSGFGEGEVEKFFYSLDQYGTDIKKIKIYGPQPVQWKNNLMPEITNIAAVDHPPCIDDLEGVHLAEFKVKGDYRFLDKRDLAFRIIIYLILGHAAMLYLTLGNYDRSLDEIRKRSAANAKDLALMNTSPEAEGYSEIIKKVNEKLKATPPPLAVMDMLALALPEGSFINRVFLNEDILEISVSSKDPLAIVKKLGSISEVKEVKLKGTPLKNSGTGLYNFSLIIELLR
ncbi:MAG: PilN domain-containing protein [Syntrophales bacterium]